MDFFAFIGKGIGVYVCFLHWHRMGQHFVFLHWHRDVKILPFTLAQGWSTVSFLMVERINFEMFVKVPSKPIKLLLRVSPSKEMGDRKGQRKKSLTSARIEPTASGFDPLLLYQLICEARRGEVPLFNGTGWISVLLFIFPQRWSTLYVTFLSFT